MKNKTFDLLQFCEIYDLHVGSTAETLKVEIPVPETKSIKTVSDAHQYALSSQGKHHSIRGAYFEKWIDLCSSSQEVLEFMNVLSSFRNTREGNYDSLSDKAWLKLHKIASVEILKLNDMQSIRDFYDLFCERGPFQKIESKILKRWYKFAKDPKDLIMLYNHLCGWDQDKTLQKMSEEVLKRLAGLHGYTPEE